jgi:rRNA maturation endonuclease Nob1
MEDLQCEMCGQLMTQEDHDYCDICGDCLEDMD